jgi:hypothetical protein
MQKTEHNECENKKAHYLHFDLFLYVLNYDNFKLNKKEKKMQSLRKVFG